MQRPLIKKLKPQGELLLKTHVAQVLELAKSTTNTVPILDQERDPMPRRPRSTKAVLSDTDLEVLKFLWKWRISTTAALSAKFYPHKNARRGYERLRVLEDAKLTQSHADSKAKKFIWMLTKKGFLTVKPHLPLLRDEGFKSATPGHDLLSAAMMLGDWLLTPQKDVRLIAEQQLLHYEEPLVKVEQPYGTSHRTDGYWYYPAKKVLIALEVQVTHQRQEFYDHLKGFYSQQRNDHIRQVLWLVAVSSMRETIKKNLASKDVDLTRHHFVGFPAFFKDGWGAELQDGKFAGSSVRDLLHGYLDQAPTPKQTQGLGGDAGEISNGTNPLPHRLLLDVRKSPHIAKADVFYEPLDNWI